MWVFDAGLHTQHLKMEDGETDVDFVERFMINYFDGCRNRGGKKYRDFIITHKHGNDYITSWGVK
jgi:hypothetical protein